MGSNEEPTESTEATELPVWVLNPREEKEVFLNWRENAWKHCSEEVHAFELCEHSAGFGVWFKCRHESRAMRDCIDKRRTKECVDEERDKFIQAKIAKQKKESGSGAAK